jgi:hypothetical protein
MNLTAATIEKITALVVADMIRAAAFNGHTVTAQEISDEITNNPEGEAATFFRATASYCIEQAAAMQENSDYLELFGAK